MESAKRRVLSQKLPGEAQNQSAEDHHLLIHSLVNPTFCNMIRACGALLKYLDKHQVGGMNLECSGAPILAIRPFSPQEIVRVDETTLSALQVFNERCHLSGCKSGSWNQQREGLSLYKLLNHCKSVMGSRHLRYMLRCLPKTTSVIQSRQVAVAYFSNPAQLEITKGLQDSLKNIKSIARYLKKLTSNQASVQDWKCLKSTVVNMLQLAQACRTNVSVNPNAPDIIRRLSEKALNSPELSTIARYLEMVFDVEMSEERCRFVVKPCVDNSLDEKKRVHNGLPDLLFQLAQEEVEDLPECMDSCTMVYVPQIGYMIAVEPWPGMPTEEEPHLLAEFSDLKFMFYTNNVPHFKSKRCLELDMSMGDTATNICEHETSIMISLSNQIISQSSLLLEVSHLACQLDCLLSLATVAKNNDWCQPSVVEDAGCLDIIDGRHPLQEQCVSTFVPNSTCMGGGNSSKMLVMTGPNACGKSVYLKQVGLIVFLAHLGSWVPAVSATVPVVDTIYSRIQTVDSVALGLSAFTVDVNQMALALNNATDKSLVLVDEFGKGTAETDGQALLASTVEYWIKAENQTPFVLVSTHFQSVKLLLKEHENAINYQTFMFERHGDELIYLYKMTPGVGTFSEANSVARKAGISEEILKRSDEILQCIGESSQLTMNMGLGVDFEVVQIFCDDFLNIDLKNEGENKVHEILSKVTNIVGK